MQFWPGWRAAIANLDVRYGRVGVGALLVVAFLAFLLIGYGYGPILTSDGRFLHELAISFAEMDFDIDRFAERYSGLVRIYRAETFLLYFYQLTLIERLSGGNWISAHILFNVIAQTATTAVAVQVAARTYRNFGAVVVVFVMSLSCWEFLQWVALTQTDTAFALLAAIQFSLIFYGLTARRTGQGLAYVVAALLLGVAAVFYRPTGPALVALGLLALGVGGFVWGRPAALRVIRIRWLLAGLLAAAGVVVLLGAALLFDPTLVPTEGLARKYVELHEIAAQGAVVNSRPETYLSPPEGYIDYVGLVLVRMVYFFWFLGDGFSFSHFVLNVAFFVPLYALVLIGVWKSIGSSAPVASQVRILAFVAISFVIVFDVFHSISLIDFDWRYRLPVYLPLFFLALIGALSIPSWFRYHQRPVINGEGSNGPAEQELLLRPSRSLDTTASVSSGQLRIVQRPSVSTTRT